MLSTTGTAEARKALQHGHLRNFIRVANRAKKGFDHIIDHRQENFDFRLRRGIIAKTEYPGVAELVPRHIWDEIGRAHV